jgi:hypothetical protein
MMAVLIASWLLFFHSAAQAQGVSNPPLGYVVRGDSGSVILDFNDKSGAIPGEAFTIFKEGEELKHPVTGASLGRLETKVAEGTLQEVLTSYSIGTLALVVSGQSIAPGMRARLRPGIEPGAAVNPGPGTRSPRWRGPAFDYQATAFAVADCKGDGKLEAAVSDGRGVYLYDYPPRDAKPLAAYSIDGTAVRIVSLEAADLTGDGRCQIFASLYNDSFARFETIILEPGSDGALHRMAEIPYLVRGFQDPQGARRLAAQQITDDASFPFGAIYPLAYRDGKYATSRPAIQFVSRPVDWLYDFTFASFDGQPATVDVTNTDLVRIRFAKGSSWKSAETYGQTPVRVRWSGDRMLQFRPALPARRDEKGTSLYAVKNLASFGGLAMPFGLFSRAELHRLDWNGLSLAPSWTAELGGYSTGLTLVSAPGGQELAVLVVSTAGKSSIWAFDP